MYLVLFILLVLATCNVVALYQSRDRHVVFMSVKPSIKTSEDSSRFDCIPEGNSTKEKCLSRECTWEPPKKPIPPTPSGLTVPECFFPQNYVSYIVLNARHMAGGATIKLRRDGRSPYPDDVQNVDVEFTYLTQSSLRIKFRDSNKTRWEPPTLPRTPQSDTSSELRALDYSVELPSAKYNFGFKVLRRSGEPILQTAGGFVYSDQLLQLSTVIPSHVLYGLGEHRQDLMINTTWTRIVLWNRDHIPQENTNLYGSHPFYVCKDATGWHGVFLQNSNAMEVIVQPAPAVTWRTIGGNFDFYVFLGSSFDSVVSQYASLVGTTFLPPYWALGFHLCWQYYGTANNTLKTMDRLRQYGIPQDVQWNDIDYAEGGRVYTTDVHTFGDQAGLAKAIHARSMHYIIMVDCGISNNATPGTYLPYDLGVKLGIFINGSDGKPLVGRVWPGTTVWPDFLHPAATQYWTEIAKKFHDKVPFDGMWVDMNEISNFIDGSINGCDPKSSYDNPPYLPAVSGGNLYTKTICPSAQHKISSHYNIHNIYGYFETYRSNRALKQLRFKRPFVISRSTFSGQGHYGGHWSGDNAATFYDMYKSISAMLHANMYGISVTGSDICGFNGNTTSELCTRWHQLGAFYTFSRNHNSDSSVAQDPGQFGPESAASTRKALLTRYSLLPYLYTLMFKSHALGSTVARPLVFEFPDDKTTYNLDSQFMWGPALMISPVLKENDRSVLAYFPKDRWYDFYSGAKVEDTGQHVRLDAPLDVINLHVRGGHVLPMQPPGLTTAISRTQPFWLLVVLDAAENANEEIFFDDGDSIDTFEQGLYNWITFSATKAGLVNTVKHSNFTTEPMALSNITVFGLEQKPSSVMLNGNSVYFIYNNTVFIIRIMANKVSAVTSFSGTHYKQLTESQIDEEFSFSLVEVERTIKNQTNLKMISVIFIILIQVLSKH